jgi:hypothetical protein
MLNDSWTRKYQDGHIQAEVKGDMNNSRGESKARKEL